MNDQAVLTEDIRLKTDPITETGYNEFGNGLASWTQKYFKLEPKSRLGPSIWLFLTKRQVHLTGFEEQTNNMVVDSQVDSQVSLTFMAIYRHGFVLADFVMILSYNSMCKK